MKMLIFHPSKSEIKFPNSNSQKMNKKRAFLFMPAGTRKKKFVSGTLNEYHDETICQNACFVNIPDGELSWIKKKQEKNVREARKRISKESYGEKSFRRFSLLMTAISLQFCELSCLAFTLRAYLNDVPASKATFERTSYANGTTAVQTGFEEEMVFNTFSLHHSFREHHIP